MNRIFFRAAVVAAIAVVVAGCSSSTGSSAQRGAPAPATPPSATQAAPMAAHTVEAPIQNIPWSEVGPGWMLAMWNAATPTNSGGEVAPGEATPYNAATTLYLVDPEGGRYAITTFAAPDESGQLPTLADWSGDGNRALFYRQGDDLTVIEIDLHSGEQTSFTVAGGYAVTPRYTRPDGKAVLLLKSNDVDSAASLRRVDLAGNEQLTYPVETLGSEFNVSVLSATDGTRLVLGTGSGLTLMGNDGTPGRELPIPDASGCTPMRWWEIDVALARCYGPDFTYSRLWLVPVDGTAPTALTAKNDGQLGEDLGDRSAWQLPAGTFLQATGGCGYQFLAKLNATDGTTTKVSVPKVDEHHSVRVLGATDGHLQLQATLSCGSGESLIDYDPAADTSTVLLGGDVNGGGVVDAVPYPDPE